MSVPVDYPTSLSIDVFDGVRDKLTTFFRPFVAVPILIIMGLLGGGSMISWQESPWSFEFPTAAMVVLPTVLMLLFQQKYPRWWFDWNLAMTRFAVRIGSFMTLLRDEYPSTDEEQAVHLDIPYPDAAQLSRGLPLVKWFLAIPHFIVLGFLSIAVFVCVVIAWFAILFTGKYPESLREFVVGFFRWELRVAAYALLLTTDMYPPFSLD
jgi:hypothetical protein